MFSLFRRKPKIASENQLGSWKSGAVHYIKECHPEPFESEKPKIQFSLSYTDKSTTDNDSIKFQRKEKPADSDIRYSDRSTDSDIRYSLSFDDSYEEEKAKNELFTAITNAEVTKTTFATAKTFTQTLLSHIEREGLKDSTVYRAANIDKRLFSKIASDRNYKPSKETATALALGLHLTLEETNDLLSRAGYQLSHSIRRDIIVEYFIRENEYNLININEVLDRLGEKIIGRL